MGKKKQLFIQNAPDDAIPEDLGAVLLVEKTISSIIDQQKKAAQEKAESKKEVSKDVKRYRELSR